MYIKKYLFSKYSTKIESKGWYNTIMVADIPIFCVNLCKDLRHIGLHQQLIATEAKIRLSVGIKNWAIKQ